MAPKLKINDTTRQALSKIRRMSHGTLVDFGEKVVEIADDNTAKPWDGGSSHRVTGNLAESIQVEIKKQLGIRVVTDTGYGIHEELRPGHEFVRPAIPVAIKDFHDQGKWDR